ncbi:hypothetical protein GF360_03325 [candidate division WWE3 bacterium]|nr:hypothetical protein [candidate division WWE3 bacterium]
MKKQVYILIACMFLLLRVLGTGNDISNSDAARWHRRSLNFLQAIKTGDLKSTYQHYQPGVTLMLLNAPLKQAATSFQRYILKTTPKTLENADYYPTIHMLSKIQLNLVLAGLLLFQIHLISKLFSNKIALIYAVLITAEPYLIGIDRWFHLTSMETYFAFTAFLSLLHWRFNFAAPPVEPSKKTKFLLISAVFFALAVLSKLTSLILAPILLALLVSNFLQNRKFTPFLLYLAGFTITFLVLFPATWVAPGYVFTNLYNAIFKAVATDSRAALFPGALKYIYYPVILVFKLSPISLLLFVGFLIQVPIKKSLQNKKAFWILAGLANYLLFLTLSTKKIDRYALVFFPFILLTVAFYIEQLKRAHKNLILALVVLFSGFICLQYFPVNSAYYSPLLGGSPTALKTGVYENSGEYFAQAADYLNTKGRDKTVWIPDNIESFNYYYKGVAVAEWQSQMDYFVTSRDIDRPNGLDPSRMNVDVCANLEKVFSDPYEDLVFIYSCY